ncbi:MAG: aldolase/citrate lyase family protein [Stellaceae bacterium]
MADDIANHMKKKLAAGDLVLCMNLRLARTVDIAMVAKAGGYDALYVDMEHSPYSIETTATICAAALGIGITPLVRVPSHEAHWSSRVLDGGAQGVIVPHVNNRGEAEAVVRNCRFPPLGGRSVMGLGPALGYRAQPLGEINDRLNAETALIVMLETAEGIENARAIAAVPGIDVLLIGSGDLTTDYGIPGQVDHPRLREAYERVAEACRTHGRVLGVGGIRHNVALQGELIRLGARFVIAGTDVNYVLAGARQDTEALRRISLA